MGLSWAPLRGPQRPPSPAAASAPTPDAPAVALPAGGLQLLVLQPSPFCNLDCRYCYLPDRQQRVRMALPVLERVLAQVMASGLVGERLAVVWHAGEPMAVPRRWYEAAFARVAQHAAGRPVTHHFQTNGVLIDEAWCAFFQRHGVRVGISIDGPATLHDAQRRTRDGRGTHARVMQGIARLRQAGIGFHTIAVLTRDALAQPDALFDFFAALGTQEAGFNTEEVEAAHGHSTLQAVGSEAAARAFWQRLLERLAAAPGALRVREVAQVLAGLRDPAFGQRSGNSQNQAGQLLSVAHDGSFCFWSPELLGTQHAQLGPAGLGNLASDTIDWARLGEQAALRRWQAEIDAGVAACRSGCAHWRLCLGGAPANKLAELGTLAGRETLACRLGTQVVIDAVLAALERDLRL